MPLIAWYLQKLAEHEKKTGVRILDVLDVHIYPQADHVQGPDGSGGDGGGETDRKTNDLRFRTTRSLWDREYEDESWIKEAVYLIPRMKDLIAQNYPGAASRSASTTSAPSITLRAASRSRRRSVASRSTA